MTSAGIERFKRFELNTNDKKKYTFWRDGELYHRSYKDPADKWTIGYGSMIEDDNLTEEEMKNLVISETEAEDRLIKEINIAEKDCRKLIPRFDNLDEVRREAITNLSYMLGLWNFKKFGDTLNYINMGAYNSAGENLKRTEWYRKSGDRSKDVVCALKYGAWPEDIAQRAL